METYQEAFEVLELEARRQGHTCTPQEISNVKQIFFVHNLIEEVGYKAFYEIVQRLGITNDQITEEQSETIIAYVKKQAHVELRKPGGYSHSGRDMITAEQFSKVIASLSTIIHDRDERLTHARYRSLADLVTAFDDHNSYIKQLLFRSWFKYKKSALY